MNGPTALYLAHTKRPITYAISLPVIREKLRVKKLGSVASGSVISIA